MMSVRSVKVRFVLCLLIGCASIALVLHASSKRSTVNIIDVGLWSNQTSFEPVDNSSDGYVVPNIVHFVRFGDTPLTFIDAVCILAALKNQNARMVMVHSDQFYFDGGRYWPVVKAVARERLAVLYRRRPTHVYGQKLKSHWRKFHARDLTRLQVLMEFGGIFLDNNCYIVKSLDRFRRFEMTVSSLQRGPLIRNQVIIAHKDARFLKLWLRSYQGDYRPEDWTYNCQRKPGKILSSHQDLAHRAEELLPADWTSVLSMIYHKGSNNWHEHFVIDLCTKPLGHLSKSTLPAMATNLSVFDHQTSKITMIHEASIKEMMMDVWPNEFIGEIDPRYGLMD